MTPSDQRTEPVFEIDLRDLSADDDGDTTVVIPEVEAAPRRPEPASLASHLEHPEVAVRLAALSDLADHPGSVPAAAVAARLHDPEPAVRRAAVKVLVAGGDERMLVLLLDAIDDPLDDIRKAVGDALRRHHSPDLVALLRGELSDPTRARAADLALAVLGEERVEGESTEQRDASDHSVGGNLSSLLAQLGHPRPERRRIACERLGFIRSASAVEPLVKRLGDPERGVRIKAADALALIGDEAALEGLERARASDPDPGVAMAVERSIAALSAGR